MWKLREAQRIRKLSIVTEQVYGGHSSSADISDGKIIAHCLQACFSIFSSHLRDQMWFL